MVIKIDANTGNEEMGRAGDGSPSLSVNAEPANPEPNFVNEVAEKAVNFFETPASPVESPPSIMEPARTEFSPRTGNARPLPYLDSMGEPVGSPLRPEPRTSPAYELDGEGYAREATDAEAKAYREYKQKRIDYGMQAVIEEIFASHRAAWELKPEEAAHRLWLERQSGIPAGRMQDSELHHEALARAEMRVAAELLERAPENVVLWFDSPMAMELARDDIAVLTEIGKAMNRLAYGYAKPILDYQDSAWNISMGYRSGTAQTELGALYTKRMKQGLTTAEEARAMELERIVEINNPINPGWMDRMLLGTGRLAGQRQDQIVRGLKWGSVLGLAAMAALATGGLGGAAVLGGSGLLGSGMTGAALVTTAFSAGMAYGAAESGYISETGLASNEFRQLRDENGNLIDPRIADIGASIYGFGASIIEMSQLDAILKAVPGIKRLFGKEAVKTGVKEALKSKGARDALLTFAKEYAGDLSFEVGTEVAQQGLQILVRESIKNYAEKQGSGVFERATWDKNVAELWETLENSFFEFAIPMLPGPLMNFGSNFQAARRAERNVQLFKTISDSSGQSKLKERTPEKFRDFVSYITRNGPVEEVGISAESFARYFQSVEMNPAEVAAELGVGDQYTEALATGGELNIPTPTFAEKIAGTEHFDGLSEDLRYGQDAMTSREAREFRSKLLQDYDQALEDTSSRAPCR